MKIPKIPYDVGDFAYWQLRIGNLFTDKKRLSREERVARIPLYNWWGALGGWNLPLTIVNGGVISLYVILPTYGLYWTLALFLSLFPLLGTQGKRRISLIEHDIIRLLRAKTEERPGIEAEILFNHIDFLASSIEPTLSPRKYVKDTRTLNSTNRILSKTPFVFYLLGVAGILSSLLVSGPLVVFLSSVSIIASVLILPVLVMLSIIAADNRRSIPPLWEVKEFESTIMSNGDSNPDV